MKISRILNKEIWSWLLITLGAIISAIGYVVFILPWDMVAGGVTGIGIIIKRLTGLPIVGLSSLLMTGIVFIIATKILGKKFGAKSIYATIVLHILIDLFSILDISINLSKNDILLASFYGGAVVGFGLGIIYFLGGSTGGADAMAQVLWKLKKIPIGRTLIVIDFLVLLIAAITFIPLRNIMYSLIFLYIEVKAIDMVLNGLRANQRIMIVTDYPEKMKKAIFSNLNRGLTIFKGVGGYTGIERFMLTSVLPKKRIPEIRRTIGRVDEKAFVIIQDVNQVYGKGFELLPGNIKNLKKK